MRFSFFLSVIGAMVFSGSVRAENKIVCEAYVPKTQNNNIVLETTTKPHIFFLKNNSTKSVWIDHKQKKSANAGWSSFLTPQHWSAISLSEKKAFNLSCEMIHPGKVEQLNCAHSLSVCVPKQVTFSVPMKNKNFWVAENKASFDELVKAIGKRKIIIN